MAANPLSPLRFQEFDESKAHRLLNRAGFGGTPEQVRALAARGPRRAVDSLVNFHRVDDGDFPPVRADDFDHDIVRPQNEEERREVRLARQRGDEALLERFRMEIQRRQRADRRQMAEIQRWWLGRMIRTPRPLEEKLTLFWHGHFATSYRGTQDSFHLFLQNRLFRAHAAGNFAALLSGIIRDPAMLRFLDNNRNRRQAPNENLAREMMELFTLGEGNLYTEQDIREAARALTGYTFYDDRFDFRREWHDDGVKTILGHTGRLDGDDFVRILLSKRIVSEFICARLYRFFVNDTPDAVGRDAQRVIVRLARELRQREYRLRPVLRRLFLSQHFYEQAHEQAIIKSPVQLIVQAVRSLGLAGQIAGDRRRLDVLLGAADLMGQRLFFPPSVAGWEGGRSWINTSTLFLRQNTLVYLLTGRLPYHRRGNRRGGGRDFNAPPLLAQLTNGEQGVSPEELSRRLLRFMLAAEPHPQRIAALARYLHQRGGRLDNAGAAAAVEALTLIAAMPEYQAC